MKKILAATLLLLMFQATTPAAVPAPAGTPERVISLGPIITETIYLLEADARLIANTSYCIMPEDARNKEKIGTVIQFNAEKIVSLAPDLVLASPLAGRRQLELLRNMGIPVVQLENPETFDKMCQMMISLGRLLGEEEKARTIVAGARRTVAGIIAQTAGLTRPKVFIQLGMKPLHTSPQNTFIHEYITFSGGTNIAAEALTGNYSRETVLAENPDVILIATMGSSQAGAGREKERWMSYPALSAAKNNRVHVLDPEIICSPTPVTFVQGLQMVVPLIHPGIEPQDNK